MVDSKRSKLHSSLYSILQEFQRAHGIDPAEHARMEGGVHEWNWLNVMINGIQMDHREGQLIYADRDFLQGTDALTARHMQSKPIQK